MATTDPVTVMIAGAGLGGLLMGLLCQQANISYHIFERSEEPRPLGGVLSLNASILPVFEQLGLMDELMSVSRPVLRSHIFDEDLKELAMIEIKDLKDVIGYDYVAFHRPELYKILESRIHPGRILLNKKVLSMNQSEHGVMIRTSDNQTHHGDILIGADGAHSAVRQSLFKNLKRVGKLTSTDDSSLNTGFVTLVGTTNPIDPQAFPSLEDNVAHLNIIIGKEKAYTWTTVTIPGNKICWTVNQQIDSAAVKETFFRNSEWGPETSNTMIGEVSGFRIGHGMTLGDLFNNTPRELISQVLLEDKLFETWTSGRTVLIGDAAHKMLPTAGQGAVSALLDAVVLINCLYELENDFSNDNIKKALEDFKAQRYEHVKEQFQQSKRNAQIQYGQRWIDNVARFLVFRVLPKSLQTKGVALAAMYRPQVAFLEFVPKRGTSVVFPQEQSKRYLREKAEGQQTLLVQKEHIHNLNTGILTENLDVEVV